MSRRAFALALAVVLAQALLLGGCFQTRVEMIPAGQGQEVPGLRTGNWLVWVDHAKALDWEHAVRLDWDAAAREYVLTPEGDPHGRGQPAPLARCRALSLGDGLYAVQYHVQDPGRQDAFLLLLRVEAQGRQGGVLVVDDAAAAALAPGYGLTLRGDLLAAGEPAKVREFLKAMAGKTRPGATPYVYVHESWAGEFLKAREAGGRP